MTSNSVAAPGAGIPVPVPEPVPPPSEPTRVSAVHRPPTVDMVLLAVGVTAVGTSGPLIAAITAPALAIAFWRNAIATGVFAPWILIRHLRVLRTLPPRTTLLALGAGAVLGLHFATWTPAPKLTSVASATAFAATQPIFAAAIAKVMGHHVPRRAWIGIGVSILGVAVLSGVDFHSSVRAFEGDLLGFAAAGFAAVYMTMGAEVRKTVSLPLYAFLCYGAASIVLVALALGTGTHLTGFSHSDWVKILSLTVLAQFLGHTVFNRVVKTTSPTVVSTAILLEVPGAAVIAAIFLHQIPSVAAIPGALLILGGLFLVVTGNRGSAAADGQGSGARHDDARSDPPVT